MRKLKEFGKGTYIYTQIIGAPSSTYSDLNIHKLKLSRHSLVSLYYRFMHFQQFHNGRKIVEL